MAVLRNQRTRTTGGLIVGLAIGAVAVVVVVAIAVTLLDPFGTEEVDRSGPALLEQMRELEEFTAAEAQFVQDVDVESDTKWVPDFIRGERVVAMTTGNVRAVVDFGGLDTDAVTVADDGTSISVTLPEPVLTDAEIEESATRIVSRDRGIIDRLSDTVSGNPFDDRELYTAAEDKLNAAAASSDLEETARANTERWMRAFLSAAGFEQVDVNWSSSPA